jgi:hypothetical protein
VIAVLTKQLAAVDELHDEVDVFGRVVRCEHRHDVQMPQRAHDAQLRDRDNRVTTRSNAHSHFALQNGDCEARLGETFQRKLLARLARSRRHSGTHVSTHRQTRDQI